MYTKVHTTVHTKVHTKVHRKVYCLQCTALHSGATEAQVKMLGRITVIYSMETFQDWEPRSGCRVAAGRKIEEARNT